MKLNQSKEWFEGRIAKEQELEVTAGIPELREAAHPGAGATFTLELTPEMLDVLRESLQYSKRSVENAQDTPLDLRRFKVSVIDDLLGQLPRIAAKIQGKGGRV